MATVGLALFSLYFAVAFGLRSWLQYRRTGDSGFRGLSGRIGSVEWWGGALFAVALVTGLSAPIADLAGLDPIDALTAAWIQGVGIVLAVAGILTTFAAQVSTGTSWRIGVDSAESTNLVTDGAFAAARNPIFTAMALTGIGLALVVPNVVAFVGLVILLAALQIQVRAVEEPHLRATHGPRWDEYSARVGRFLPGLGKSLPLTTINDSEGPN